MRTLFPLLFLPGLLLSACTKKEVVVNTPVRPPYRVEGLTDILLTRSPFTPAPNRVQYLNISYQSGASQKVTLGLAGLPAGLTDSFSTRSGYPDFYTLLHIKDAGIAKGAYDVALTLKAETDSVAKRLPFKVIVSGDTSCANFYADRTFSAFRRCANVQQEYDIFIRRAAPGNDTLVFQNFLGNGETLKATFDCRNGTFRARPQQLGTTNNYYVVNGTLNGHNPLRPDEIFVSYTEYQPGGGFLDCEIYLTSK